MEIHGHLQGVRKDHPDRPKKNLAGTGFELTWTASVSDSKISALYHLSSVPLMYLMHVHLRYFIMGILDTLSCICSVSLGKAKDQARERYQ